METCAVVYDALRRFVRATPCHLRWVVSHKKSCSKSEGDMSDDEKPAPAFSSGKPFRGKGVDDSWKRIQERTFTNWANDRLRGNLKVAKRQVRTY